MKRVWSVPNSSDWGEESGIRRVVEAYSRYLPEFDWQIVNSPHDQLDIVAVHAGVYAPLCHVAHCHGLYWTSHYHAAVWEWDANKRVTEMCRVARKVIVPSDWVAETFRRDMHLNPVVLGHGLDLEDWPEPSKTHEGYGLWNKNRRGDVCDPTPVGMLARGFPQHRFVTTFKPTGDFPNLREIGIQSHERMKQLLLNAGVYIATTKETFGIGILEAMACGVPVLGYAHGGILEMVQHGVNGYLARLNDEDDLKAGFDYCLRNRAALGANGREMVKPFGWRKIVERLAQVYDEATFVPLPKAAIIIPSYNYAGKLHNAIRSALEQDFPLLEWVIVVDDGSPDDGATREVVAGWTAKDKRVVYIRQDNRGVAIARNTGIEYAWKEGAKYVACLDADDWLSPKFLSTCIPPLEKSAALGITYTGLFYHKPDGTQGLSQWPGDWDFDAQVMRRNQVPTACVFRVDMWRRLGGYRQRYAPLGAGSEDAEFWLRSGANGFKAEKVTNEGLFHYSWQSGSVSGNPAYKEVDWLSWHPWAGKEGDTKHPFASYAKPKARWHPVRQYDEPLVSVIIPVGPHHQQYLWDALDSLEGQTFRNWEAVVVMDTREKVLPAIRDAFPYVRWGFTHGKGAGAARNEGARLARAPFLMFLDADDYLLPKCLDIMLETWRVENAIPYSDYLGKAHVDDVSKLAPDLQSRVYFHNTKTHEALIGYRAANFDCEVAARQPELPYPFIWCNVTCLVPKPWHEAIGGFDEKMKSWEDVEYNWRLARAGRCFVRIPQELMVYRFSTGQRRQDGLREHQSIVEYVRGKWRGNEAVPCGCSGNGQATLVQSPQVESRPVVVALAGKTNGRPMVMDDANFVLARYLHPNIGEHTVVGTATGTKYGFRGGGDIFLVHREDVAAQPHLFAPVEQKPTPVPVAARQAPPPPQPVMATVTEEPQAKKRGRPKKIKA